MSSEKNSNDPMSNEERSLNQSKLYILKVGIGFLRFKFVNFCYNIS